MLLSINYPRSMVTCHSLNVLFFLDTQPASLSPTRMTTSNPMIYFPNTLLNLLSAFIPLSNTTKIPDCPCSPFAHIPLCNTTVALWSARQQCSCQSPVKYSPLWRVWKGLPVKYSSQPKCCKIFNISHRKTNLVCISMFWKTRNTME